MKRILLPGIVAGLTMLAVSMIFSWVLSALAPNLTGEYANTALFRPWSDPLMSLFFLYPTEICPGIVTKTSRNHVPGNFRLFLIGVIAHPLSWCSIHAASCRRDAVSTGGLQRWRISGCCSCAARYSWTPVENGKTALSSAERFLAGWVGNQSVVDRDVQNLCSSPDLLCSGKAGQQRLAIHFSVPFGARAVTAFSMASRETRFVSPTSTPSTTVLAVMVLPVVSWAVRTTGVLLFGGCAPGTTVTYDAGRIHYDEITLKGVFHYTPSYVKKAYKLLCDGELRVSRLISGRYPLTHTQKVFEKLSKGTGIKYAIIP